MPSKKRPFSLDDMPTLKVKKNAKLKAYDPAAFFKDEQKVKAALLQSLAEKDFEAFNEILAAYLRILTVQ